MSTETTTKTEALANLPKGTDLKSLNKALDYLETMLDDPNEVLLAETRRFLVSLRNSTLKMRNQLQKKKYASEHHALSEEEEIETPPEEPKTKRTTKVKDESGSSKTDKAETPATEKTKTKKKKVTSKAKEKEPEEVEEKEESFDWSNGLFGKSWK
jgi:hypothetical protein